jgi:hypothetical protein
MKDCLDLSSRNDHTKLVHLLEPLLEPPLTAERVAEMLLHAYSYVRDVDPDGKTGAANLLWSKYNDLEQNQQVSK